MLLGPARLPLTRCTRRLFFGLLVFVREYRRALAVVGQRVADNVKKVHSSTKIAVVAEWLCGAILSRALAAGALLAPVRGASSKARLFKAARAQLRRVLFINLND